MLTCFNEMKRRAEEEKSVLERLTHFSIPHLTTQRRAEEEKRVLEMEMLRLQDDLRSERARSDQRERERERGREREREREGGREG